MRSAQFVINDPVGLHARPAAMFVKLASSFQSDVSIRNLSGSEKWANAKSILGLLTCGVKQGDQVEVKAEGSDEAQVVEALEKLVRSNFAEEV